MRTPRDLDGARLVQRLGQFGYEATRQSGSHVRLTRVSDKSEHHVTIPLHSPLRVGTLNAVLGEIAAHLGVSKAEVIRQVS